ncbi:hypothetical protein VNO77_41670 [Canavalia gladiata]|uniref:Uncharacterized protein n=1 Tax=Canavalia gladiata TaxID=3824 RepID=A0AAN9PRR4_CANGL
MPLFFRERTGDVIPMNYLAWQFSQQSSSASTISSISSMALTVLGYDRIAQDDVPGFLTLPKDALMLKDLAGNPREILKPSSSFH